MKLHSLCVATAALLLLACRSSDKDTYVVVHSDVSCDVPRVFQLRITVTNGGMVDQHTLPEVRGPELAFPSSLTLVIPGSRSGDVEVALEAIDGSGQLVGGGTARGKLVPADRADLQVLITTAMATGAAITFPSSSGSDAGASVDAGTSAKADAQPGSGVDFSFASAGSVSTCALRVDNSLWCWGDNKYGILRVTGTSTRLRPTEATPSGWSAVSVGVTHACGLRTDGTLSCWGNNGSGQLGAGNTGSDNLQVEVPDGPWQSVSAGIYQTCAIKTDGTLWCWGDNGNGQLGTGNRLAAFAPTQVSGSGYVQVSSRFLHTCAVKEDGTMWCWGINNNLQLAQESPATLYQPEQVAVSGWRQVAVGFSHTCGIKQDSSLWCWGANMTGQIGAATLPVEDDSRTSTPLQIPGTWTTVSAGATHTCGIMVDGTLWCWGDNSAGQLGLASKISQSSPTSVTVPGLGWSQVSTGLVHTCAVATDASLWCWGEGSDGELGVGSSEDRLSPTRVTP